VLLCAITPYQVQNEQNTIAPEFVWAEQISEKVPMDFQRLSLTLHYSSQTHWEGLLITLK